MSRQRPGDIIPHQQEIESIIDQRLAQVFEVTDLLVPAGTDWSNLGHHFGQVTIVSGGSMFCSMVLVLDAPLDPEGADELWFAAASGGPDWATNSARYKIELPGITGTEVWGFSSTFVPIYNPNVANNALADDTEFRLNLDPYQRAGGGIDFAAPPEDAILDIGLWSNAPFTSDITIVRARAAFLVI